MRTVGPLLIFIAIKFVYHAAVPSPKVRFVLDLLLIAGAAIYVVFAYRREQKAKKAQQADDQKSS